MNGQDYFKITKWCQLVYSQPPKPLSQSVVGLLRWWNYMMQQRFTQWVNKQWFSPTSRRISFPLRSHRRCEGRMMVQMLSHIHEDKASLGSHRRCEGRMVQMLSHVHEDNKASLGSHKRCEGWMVQLSVTQVTIGDNF